MPRTSNVGGRSVGKVCLAPGCATLRAPFAMSVPNMSDTICSSLPLAVSVTPTVTPSRRTVVRSHSAETSAMRCEIKMTAWPRSRHRRIISNTFSAISEGSAAVISSSRRTFGSEAKARARSMRRRIGCGRISDIGGEIDFTDAHLLQVVHDAFERNARQTHILRQRQIRHKRGVLIDRDDSRATCLGGRMEMFRDPRKNDRAGIAWKHPGYNLNQGALACAIGAHQCVDLARPHPQLGRAKRLDGAKAFRHAPYLEESNSLTHKEYRPSMLPALPWCLYGPLQASN